MVAPRAVVKAVVARMKTDQLVGVVFDTGPGRYGQPDVTKTADGRVSKHVVVRPAYHSIRYERLAGGRTAAVVYVQVVHVGWHLDEVAAARRRVARLLDDWAPLPGATGLRETTTTHGEEQNVSPYIPFSISEYRTELPGGAT